jgi:hypothetical protein
MARLFSRYPDALIFEIVGLALSLADVFGRDADHPQQVIKKLNIFRVLRSGKIANDIL